MCVVGFVVGSGWRWGCIIKIFLMMRLKLCVLRCLICEVVEKICCMFVSFGVMFVRSFGWLIGVLWCCWCWWWFCEKLSCVVERRGFDLLKGFMRCVMVFGCVFLSDRSSIIGVNVSFLFIKEEWFFCVCVSEVYGLGVDDVFDDSFVVLYNFIREL